MSAQCPSVLITGQVRDAQGCLESTGKSTEERRVASTRWVTLWLCAQTAIETLEATVETEALSQFLE